MTLALQAPPAATEMPPLDLEQALATCLDPDAIRPWLQRALPGIGAAGQRIASIDLLDVRRNASRRRQPHPLTLRYALALEDAAGRPQGTRHCFGKLCRDAAGAAASADAQAIRLPGLELLLWDWPADPGLPQLPALLDPDQARRWWTSPADAIELVRYRPEHRATLCYRRGDAGSMPDTLWAKTFSNDLGQAIHRRFEHLWQRAPHDERAPRVAEPLAWDPATRTLWQRAAQGRPLQGLIEIDGAAGLAAAMAAAMAVIHDMPPALASSACRDSTHWLREVQRRQRRIARVAPSLEARAERLADWLAATAAGLALPATGCIHADCHPDQFWIGPDGRVVLFDLDETCLGDPMEDLAEFLTRLRTLRHGDRFATALLGAYIAQAPQHFSHRRLQWHLALQQLLQACRAFSFQVDGWQGLMDERLARAEALAARAGEEVMA